MLAIDRRPAPITIRPATIRMAKNGGPGRWPATGVESGPGLCGDGLAGHDRSPISGLSDLVSGDLYPPHGPGRGSVCGITLTGVLPSVSACRRSQEWRDEPVCCRSHLPTEY
jgi:hypothetical protein